MYDLFYHEEEDKIKTYNNLHTFYKKPTIDLLDKKEQSFETVSIDYSEKIEQFYKIFNINFKVNNFIDSLSVSRFYATLTSINSKSKISTIEKLTSDLAIYLNVKNVKLTVESTNGEFIFEIPKNSRQTLYFRDIIEEQQIEKNGLTVTFGKDLNNNIFNVNLCKMPHLLIAGTTGSGKSVFINSIILNLIYNYTPEEVKFLMIDPKMVELSIYENIPHLQAEIATDTQKAKQLLDYAIEEMQERYNKMKTAQVRNIESYNIQAVTKLPYVVIIIDELADLVLSDKNKSIYNNTKVDEKINRLAQMGRACGIHLIVATQRPSVNVITGLIKANIPSRISFSVANMYDSKVILDEKGAEKLIGNGDMYLKIVGNSELIRLQGAFVSDNEVKKVVDYIK